MTDDTKVMQVPCAVGSRLSFSWGTGAQLQLVELGRDGPGTQLTTALWWVFGDLVDPLMLLSSKA